MYSEVFHPAPAALDPFLRRIDYLRISITDRCNERCQYCMPEGYKGWTKRADHLTASEIIATAAAAVRIGFGKFRITGGEPLVRDDVVEICAGIAALDGVESLAVSTNGTRLAKLAGELAESGVGSVNVSLDAVDAAVYHKITGGEIAKVLRGIDSALDAGLSVKLNCVLLRGVNENQILPLIGLAATRDLPIRFIELMPLSRGDVLSDGTFLPVGEVMAMLRSSGTLTEDPSFRPGNGPARYFRFDPCGARVGFIGSITDPHFCERCNKLRLTADGKIRPCLGRHGEVDLLAPLRAGRDPAEILRAAIAAKPRDHEFLQDYTPARPMTAIGG